MLRAKRGGLIYRGDLYIRAWQLQSESRQRAHQHQRNLCLSVRSIFYFIIEFYINYINKMKSKIIRSIFGLLDMNNIKRE